MPTIIVPLRYCSKEQVKLALRLTRELGRIPDRRWISHLSIAEADEHIQKLNLSLKRRAEYVRIDPLGIAKKAQQKSAVRSPVCPRTHAGDSVHSKTSLR